MAIGTVTWGTIIFVSGGTTPLTPAHSSPAAGDLLLLYCYSYGTTATFTQPSGWGTLVSQTQTANGSYIVFWKAATGSEGTTTQSVSVSLGTNSTGLAVIGKIPGASTSAGNILSGTPTAGTFASSDQTVTNTGITTSHDGALVVFLQGRRDGNNTTNTEFTSWANATNPLSWSGGSRGSTSGNDAALGVATALKATQGATGNVTCTQSGAGAAPSAAGITYVFAVREAAATTYNTTLNADAYLAARRTVTETVDAYAIKRGSATENLDAYLIKRGTAAQDADSYIATRLNTTQDTDTILAYRNSVTESIDAYLGVSPLRELTQSIDAVLANRRTVPQGVDGYTANRISISAAADSFLATRKTVTQNLDSYVASRGTVASLIDSYALYRNNQTETVDAYLAAARNFTQSADALLSTVRNTTETIDAVLQATLTASQNADAVLQQSKAVTSFADAVLLQTKTTSAQLDAVLQARKSVPALVDAWIQPPGVNAVTAQFDALLQKTDLVTVEIDAYLGVRRDLTLATDTYLGRTQNITQNIDSILQGTRATLQNFDAWVGALSSNSIPQPVDSYLSTVTQKLLTQQLDAFLQKTAVILTVDAYLAGRFSASQPHDAYLAAHYGREQTADAYVQRPRTPTIFTVRVTDSAGNSTLSSPRTIYNQNK